MGIEGISGALRHLAGPGDALTDRELLSAFADTRDDRAFHRLVDRHGQMVLGVCKRVTGDHHAAEDAFQATFLVLARKAADGDWQESVANWLHGVAYRTALRARAEVVRGRRDAEAPGRSTTPPSDAAGWSELRGIIDGEIAKLPENLRVPVLLCCLHDQTVEEAAGALGVSPTTLKGRLQQGRELLRKRLVRRGIGVTASVLGVISSGEAVLAVPRELAKATIASVVAPSSSGLAAELARQELRVFLGRKLTLVGLGVGLTGLAVGLVLTKMSTPPVPPPSSPRKEQTVTVRVWPKSSEPVLSNGLEVTVRPTKLIFGTDEDPELELVFAHRPGQSAPAGKPQPLVSSYVAGDVWWEIAPLGQSDMWVPSKLPPIRRDPVGFQVFPGSGATQVEYVRTEPLLGPWNVTGKPEGWAKLPAGRYTAIATLDLGGQGQPRVRGGRELVPEWKGKLTTKPVIFEVSSIPLDSIPVRSPLVIRKADAGNVLIVRVGQGVAVELETLVENAGWQPRTRLAGNVLTSEEPVFSPSKFFPGEKQDPRLGTYRFPFTATAPGEVELTFDQVSPGAPWPLPGTTEGGNLQVRDTFRVTLRVEK